MWWVEALTWNHTVAALVKAAPDLHHVSLRNCSGDRVNKESMTLPEPIKGALGATILGPRNIPLERENPDLLASPETDAGTIPNLKFSFAAARNRVLTGGWAREVTMRELPIA